MSPWFEFGMTTILLLLTIALAAAAVRVVIGPSFADRVVALDLVAFVSVCLITTGAILTAQGPLLDVALVLSMLSFLGTTAFARFLERQFGKDDV